MINVNHTKSICVTLLVVLFQLLSTSNYAQLFEIESTTDGFLPPRMTTTQRDDITNLSDGLIIYNTTNKRVNYYDGSTSTWVELYPNSVLDYFVDLPSGIATVYEAGETVANLISSNASIEALLSAPVPIDSLLDNGLTIAELYAAGASIQSLLDASPTVQDLLDASITLQDILDEPVHPSVILSESSLVPADLIGSNFGGGIIFYLLGDGTGYVSAAVDQGMNKWGCDGMMIDGADGINIGTGKQNTADIVAGCADPSFAAKTCNDLTLNDFSDWFLPSSLELFEMYNTIGQGATGSNNNIGNFTNGLYLSSSEHNDTLAKTVDFSDGSQSQFSKSFAGFYVRAIRQIINE